MLFDIPVERIDADHTIVLCRYLSAHEKSVVFIMRAAQRLQKRKGEDAMDMVVSHLIGVGMRRRGEQRDRGNRIGLIAEIGIEPIGKRGERTRLTEDSEAGTLIPLSQESRITSFGL